ncbi:MAG: VOC family protein, partial [Candidatus Acidiferrales bacterium]
MINGVHALIYAKDAEKVRAFFRDILGFKSVDAGHGWLIFALPPAEAAFH